MSLTIGGIQDILNGIKLEKPIFRITNMKKMTTENNAKVRLIITDGQTSHSYVMVGSALNSRFDSGEIAQGSMIQLDNYIVKVQNDKKVVMIIDLTVVTAQNIENIPPMKPAVIQYTKPVGMQSARPVGMQSSNIPTIDINLINPYQNKWSIKGRVLKKDTIKTWSNPKGEGKLFNFILIDDSCDVKVTSFNHEVDKFYDLIEVDKTYILSKGIVKVADRRYNSTKCDHEITLKADSEITEVQGDLHIPAMIYNFVEIAHIKDCSTSATVDVVGVAHEIKDATTILSKKTNKELTKREVVLVDRSGSSINLTLWNQDVKHVDNVQHPVIVVRGADIKEFNGRSLSVGFNSIIKINPVNLPEAKLLLGWYQAGGHESLFTNQSNTGGGSFATKKATISELACTSGDKGDYFMVEAVVANIKKDNIVYKSCGKCNKKVVDHNNGLYGCVKCDIESPDFKYRLMINLNILDHTGNLWVTAFQDSAEKILGLSSDDIGHMVENEQSEEVEKLISNVLYKEDILFKIRVSNDTYNDETRLKAVLNSWNVVDTKDSLAELFSELSV